MKLISMTDFVLEQTELYKEDKLSVFDFALRMKKHAQFLEQPLKLEMFVPCDDEWNVLFKGFEITVSNITKNIQNNFLIISETNEIIGSENKNKWFFNPYNKVEDLIDYNLTLTENATKQFL